MKKITASEAFSRAWEIFKKDPVQHVGVFFLLMIIQGFFNYLGEKSILFSIINFIVQIIVGIFLVGYALDVVRGQYKDFNDTFKRYVNLSVIGNYLAFILLIILGAIVLVFPLIFGSAALGKAGIFISLFGGLILFYLIIRLFFGQYLILDGQHFADAIQNSWKTTSPYVMEIFLLFIITFLVMIIGFLALIIGIFVVMPIIYFAQATFYVAATGSDETANNLPEESAE